MGEETIWLKTNSPSQSQYKIWSVKGFAVQPPKGLRLFGCKVDGSDTPQVLRIHKESVCMPSAIGRVWSVVQLSGRRVKDEESCGEGGRRDSVTREVQGALTAALTSRCWTLRVTPHHRLTRIPSIYLTPAALSPDRSTGKRRGGRLWDRQTQ